jgi:hypothetical protein
MDFRVGVRGWCYILERHGLLKGDFEDAERLITNLRKEGILPLDICAEDDSRITIGLEHIDAEDDPENEADNWINHLLNFAHLDWKPISFWAGLNIYIEAAVEKLDLRNLFEPVCRELHVPITSFKGWYDVNQRAAMMRRFKEHEAKGRQCFLLLCTDHDPGGLNISDWMCENFAVMSNAYSDAEGKIDWSPDKLKIERFGLNKEFIDPRKCEANALVVVPEMGRQLMRDAIMKYLPKHALVQYQNRLKRQQDQLQKAIRERMGE